MRNTIGILIATFGFVIVLIGTKICDKEGKKFQRDALMDVLRKHGAI